jgi:PadR family transcriptional regulator PadR
MASKALTGASAQSIVLSLLDRRENYGYQILKSVHELSDGEVEWIAGSLYPLLHRMTADGLVESEWIEGDGVRRRRIYRITVKGQEKLASERQDWLAVHRIFARLWDLQPSLT